MRIEVEQTPAATNLGSTAQRVENAAPLEILITNITLASRSGTETFTRDLALGLLREGHSPTVFTPEPGAIADEIRAAGVPVLANLDAVARPPDLIHAHHGLPALAAIARFPGTPAIFVVHDRRQWTDVPPLHPSIAAYVAVDENVLDRLVVERGIDQRKTRIIHNAVDLDRFRPRPPLPAQPRRALVFSNYAREDGLLPILREACRLHGIALDVAGAGAGRQCEHPEEILGNQDLVFGKGRCALEALAVGCAVVVCDSTGIAGLVGERELRAWRRLNFGARTITRPLSVRLIADEIARYDGPQAHRVARRIREEAALPRQISAFVELYREVVLPRRDEASSPETNAAALAAEIVGLFPPWRQFCGVAGNLAMAQDRGAWFEQQTTLLRERLDAVELEVDERARAMAEELQRQGKAGEAEAAERELWQRSLADLRARADWFEGRFEDALAERDAARLVLQQIEASPLYRLRQALSRLPLVGSALAWRSGSSRRRAAPRG